MHAPSHSLTEVWPPDDTEESVLGTDFHQLTILNVRLGINEVAHLRQRPDTPLPWQALSHITLVGCRRPDGSDYHTLPDVFVYPQPIDKTRRSVSLDRDGPPVLIIEVLSESTYQADLDLARGKGYSYARAGVREYLTLDPFRQFLDDGTQGRGWRLEAGAYVPWEPDARGRWRSQQIDVEIGFEDEAATVYTPEGRRQLHEGEIASELAHRDAELEQRNREISRKDAEIERLRRRLREHGLEDADDP